jgi:hypothetical protein
MREPINPHGFDEHKLNTELAQRNLENFNEHQADTRARVDTLAKLVFAISGGALTISLGLFLRENAPVLDASQAALLRSSWLCLFAGMAGFALVLATLITQAYLLSIDWRAQLEGKEPRSAFFTWSRRTEFVSWFFGLPAFISFLYGLGSLAWLAMSLVHP